MTVVVVGGDWCGFFVVAIFLPVAAVVVGSDQSEPNTQHNNTTTDNC